MEKLNHAAKEEEKQANPALPESEEVELGPGQKQGQRHEEDARSHRDHDIEALEPAMQLAPVQAVEQGGTPQHQEGQKRQ